MNFNGKIYHSTTSVSQSLNLPISPYLQKLEDEILTLERDTVRFNQALPEIRKAEFASFIEKNPQSSFASYFHSCRQAYRWLRGTYCPEWVKKVESVAERLLHNRSELEETQNLLKALNILERLKYHVQAIKETWGDKVNSVVLENVLTTLLDINLKPWSEDLLTTGNKVLAEQKVRAAFSEFLAFYSGRPSLMLQGCKLNRLPTCVYALRKIGCLDLSGNSLSDLSPYVRAFDDLAWADLSDNNFIYFPRAILLHKDIEDLRLNDNPLTSIPEDISVLRSLRHFSATYTELTTLPRSIGKLPNLTGLEIQHNEKLRGVPLEIMDLSPECEIRMEKCSRLTPSVLARIRQMTQAPDYRGPRFSYSMVHENVSLNSDKTIFEILYGLYRQIDQIYTPFKNIPNDIVDEFDLHAWLSRLTWLKDYNSSEERKNWLITNIVKYLNFAEENPQFRERFGVIINGASETCGDRIALSIVYLGLAYQELTINRVNTEELRDFLLTGGFTVSLLETCARNKIPTMPFFDEIEVYLGYIILLKHRLNIPIDVEHMLYSSDLTYDDLDQAYSYVTKILADEAVCAKYLESNDTWQKAIKEAKL